LSTPNLEFLATLEGIIQERLQNPAEGSYTASLASAGRKRIAQKVGEEAIELALASTVGDRTETIDEAADLLYHMLVLLNHQDITLKDVVAALEARHSR